VHRAICGSDRGLRAALGGAGVAGPARVGPPGYTTTGLLGAEAPTGGIPPLGSWAEAATAGIPPLGLPGQRFPLGARQRRAWGRGAELGAGRMPGLGARPPQGGCCRSGVDCDLERPLEPSVYAWRAAGAPPPGPPRAAWGRGVPWVRWATGASSLSFRVPDGTPAECHPRGAPGKPEGWEVCLVQGLWVVHGRSMLLPPAPGGARGPHGMPRDEAEVYRHPWLVHRGRAKQGLAGGQDASLWTPGVWMTPLLATGLDCSR